jgi:hypothetical protein
MQRMFSKLFPRLFDTESSPTFGMEDRVPAWANPTY